MEKNRRISFNVNYIKGMVSLTQATLELESMDWYWGKISK